MIAYRLYKKLLDELLIIEARLEELKRQNRTLEKFMGGPREITAQQYDGGPKASGRVGFETLINQYIDNEREMLILLEVLEDKQEVKKSIDCILGDSDCLHSQVAYKRLVEGKTLQDIADEMGYSLKWIEKISASLDLNHKL